MFRGFRSCLTLIGLVVVVLVGYLVYASMRRPAAVPAAPAAGASQAAQAAQAASLDARLASAEAAIRQNAATGQHKPASFTVTDPEITARVNEAIARGEVQAPVSNVRVNTVPGQVNIAGQATASVVAVPFTMTAVPRVNNGKAQLQVTGIDFGGLPVPGPLASQLTNAVGSDNLLGDLPLTVTSFRAEQGRLVLEGTT
ncbi:MAG TPA: hypothetical protein VMW62_04365 [Chloroflexota bacterium]|nr:hypothetical protein [Chloroflexota bacterium]